MLPRAWLGGAGVAQKTAGKERGGQQQGEPCRLAGQDCAWWHMERRGRSGMTPRLHRTDGCGRTGSSGRGSTWPIAGGSGAEAKGLGARRAVFSSWSPTY